MKTLDTNSLHEIASGFVTLRVEDQLTDHNVPDYLKRAHVIRVGEVRVQSFLESDSDKAAKLHGLLVVETMKLLTGVLETKELSCNRPQSKCR